jgi:hypothetical protein
MFEQDIHVNQFMLGYAEELMKEIPDERLAEQPLPGVNHPAWIIGHLALTGDFAVKLLGGEQTLPKSWILQFGPKSTPSTERDIYPTKEELLNQLMERFELARQLAVSHGLTWSSGFLPWQIWFPFCSPDIWRCIWVSFPSGDG